MLQAGRFSMWAGQLNNVSIVYKWIEKRAVQMVRQDLMWRKRRGQTHKSKRFPFSPSLIHHFFTFRFRFIHIFFYQFPRFYISYLVLPYSFVIFLQKLTYWSRNRCWVSFFPLAYFSSRQFALFMRYYWCKCRCEINRNSQNFIYIFFSSLATFKNISHSISWKHKQNLQHDCQTNGMVIL